MATPADAEVMLKLYDLRREETMRAARSFIGFEFNPKTVDEFKIIHQPTHPHNAHWRQVVSYWEMAASIALSGAVDMELWSETQGEAIFVRAKFAKLSEEATGNTFMPRTAKIVEQSPAAKRIWEMMQKRFEAK